MPTIGIECHVQFKTKTKLFAAIDNDARRAAPNTLISHICLGLPGALPVLNEKAVEFATRAAYALGTKPQKNSAFDRKHYFYPDLPMGYQITQFNMPIITDGRVVFVVNGKQHSVRIHEAHLEADAGKNTHPTGHDYTLVDLNRAGTPLLEIVSKPEMHSAAEARAYAEELYLLMKYAGVSDCDLYHGNMRFDVNVSVSNDDNLGTRTETKNLNSFKAVERAAQYEIERQTKLLEKGEKVVQETRGWDESKQKTVSQRGKEQAHDYRYMPDPDLPPIVLDDAYIDRIVGSMPQLPDDWRKILSAIGLNEQQMHILLHADVERDTLSYLAIIQDLEHDLELAKAVANWIINVEIPMNTDAQRTCLSYDERKSVYVSVHGLVSSGKLSSTNAKQLITDLLASSDLPDNIEQFASDHGLIQLSDETVLTEIVKQVVSENPQAVSDIQAGQTKVYGFLVGQVMKASKGAANPELARKLIDKELQQ